MAWRDYIDESYNSRTFCVGGWLASNDGWSNIESAWLERIKYENRISAKKGMSPISRYHAADCANLKKEFSTQRGWNIPRQIRLTKRLCQILGDNVLWGVVFGGAMADIKKHFADGDKVGLYRASFAMHLIQIGRIMEEHFPNDRVTVYYERSEEFGSVAADSFDRFMRDSAPGTQKLSKHFITAAPMGWEDCIPLQAADFIAYEGMKWADKSLAGSDVVRKSLRAMKVPLTIAHFTDDNFQELSRLCDPQR